MRILHEIYSCICFGVLVYQIRLCYIDDEQREG